MERFSNQFSELLNQVKKELLFLDIRKEETCVANYSAHPSFSSGHISVFLIYNEFNKNYRLIKKNWDNEYDRSRFLTGVYNLDRLRITTTTVELSNGQQKEWENIIDKITTVPETLETKNYILLDGTEFKLMLKIKNVQKTYQWKVPTEDLEHLNPIIEFLCTKFC